MVSAANILFDGTIDRADVEFLADQVRGLTVERVRMLVSEWAEEKRYLPPELTVKPGKWDNRYTPYLVEPMDCLSANNPARKIVVEKGGQIGATTGLLENFIGYTIDHEPCGMIYVSADKELTKMGMELKIDRMLYHSGLQDRLSAPDGKSKRSGDTSTLKEFPNGFLLAVGARSPGKLRSTSARNAALDELDGMPIIVGGIGQEEGNPVLLVEKRTDSYSSSRKILYLSTPLKLQTSLIHPLFLAGDQRHYHIPCRHCGHFQRLQWHGVTEAGKGFGFVWDLDHKGKLIESSVGYCCEECSAIFYNHDKAWFLPRGKWISHSETEEEGLVSFHMPAFLSPPGAYPWKGSVYKWLKAWDTSNDRPRDIEELQQFYNLERGLPWEERGESPKFERVQQHRRAVYSESEIPNEVAIRETGAPILLLTCAVDVHGDRLDVEVLAWCQDRQTYSIEWLHLDGDPGCAPHEGPWALLSELIEDREWGSDTGHVYRVQATLIDVGWAEKADAVYQFAQQYSSGVYPVMGRDMPMKGALIREFQESESKLGNRLFNVTATMYKDRMASWLKTDWVDGQVQPLGYPNYPVDRGDDFFRQYEAEEKVELIDARTKKRKGWAWRQIGQRPNHAWDCRVYNMAAFDMIVQDVCLNQLELEKANYPAFFQHATPYQNAAGAWVAAPFAVHPKEVRR